MPIALARTTPVHTDVGSPVGLLRLIAADGALTGLYMDAQRHLPTARSFGVRDDAAAPFAAARSQLAAYFAGERTAFDLPIRFEGTAFQQQVWTALRRIPYGETRTYRGLAEAIGSPQASRAVGHANARNPIAIVVPCHRVLGSNRTLTGYAGGLERKRLLLDLEAAG